MSEKPIHAKPALYAHCFYRLQDIARRHGYCLALHGSLSRDLDLIAIPWTLRAKTPDKMIRAFARALGGRLQMHRRRPYGTAKPHGRIAYVIDLARYDGDYYDRQYYVDVSVLPRGPRDVHGDREKR